MSDELDALRSDMRQRLRSLIEFPLDKAQPALTADMLEMFVRAIIADHDPIAIIECEDCNARVLDTNAPKPLIADPLPKDGEAGFYLNAKVHQWLKDAPRQELVDELISLYHQHHHDEARIAELERVRDDEDRNIAKMVRQLNTAEADAARLRKAVEAAATKCADAIASADEPADWHTRIEAVRASLTAALQPEPGTDPQPARGEDSPG